MRITKQDIPGLLIAAAFWLYAPPAVAEVCKGAHIIILQMFELIDKECDDFELTPTGRTQYFQMMLKLAERYGPDEFKGDWLEKFREANCLARARPETERQFMTFNERLATYHKSGEKNLYKKELCQTANGVLTEQAKVFGWPALSRPKK